jgi:hypothetical protein
LCALAQGDWLKMKNTAGHPPAHPQRQRRSLQPGDSTVAEQQQPKFRIQDNSSIIETYANKCLGAVFDGSAVNLTFGSLRVPLEKTDEGPIEKQQPVVQVTHRLTLSPAAAIELINGLNATFTALRQAQAQAQRVAQQPGHA